MPQRYLERFLPVNPPKTFLLNCDNYDSPDYGRGLSLTKSHLRGLGLRYSEVGQWLCKFPLTGELAVIPWLNIANHFGDE